MCLPQGHFILKYFFPFVTSHDRSSPSARTASRSLSVCFGLKAITLESPDRLPARRDPTHLLRAGERQCASTHSRIMPQVAGCCRIFFSTVRNSHAGLRDTALVAPRGRGASDGRGGVGSVSYTHLTLPT